MVRFARVTLLVAAVIEIVFRGIPALFGSPAVARLLNLEYPLQDVNHVHAFGAVMICLGVPLAPSVAKRAWARLIKQVYEADPLVCPRCAGAMRIIAFIEQPAVFEKILRPSTPLARPYPSGQ